MTELSVAEDKSPDTSATFSDEYCNHTMTGDTQRFTKN